MSTLRHVFSPGSQLLEGLRRPASIAVIAVAEGMNLVTVDRMARALKVDQEQLAGDLLRALGGRR